MSAEDRKKRTSTDIYGQANKPVDIGVDNYRFSDLSDDEAR